MSQKTVLYVEDNEFNRKIVRQLLAKTTYRLREAADGEAGMLTSAAATVIPRIAACPSSSSTARWRIRWTSEFAIMWAASAR